MRAFKRRLQTARKRHMIVLDQNAVRKIQAMVLPSAAADCIFVEHSQAGCSLASIENACLGTGDSFHKFSREGCNSAQPLQQVQNDSLAGKDHTSVVTNDGDGLSAMHANSVENL